MVPIAAVLGTGRGAYHREGAGKPAALALVSFNPALAHPGGDGVAHPLGVAARSPRRGQSRRGAGLADLVAASSLYGPHCGAALVRCLSLPHPGRWGTAPARFPATGAVTD